MNDRTARQRARKAGRARLGFYVHLTAYLAVSALLIAINLLTSTQRLWFVWPLLGWGIGIAAHAAVTLAVSRRAVLAAR